MDYRIVVLLVVASGLTGTYLGYQYKGGQVAKKQVEVLETVIDTSKEQVKEDTKLIAAQAVRRVRQVQNVKTIEMKGVLDAANKADPVHVRDPESFRLLLDAIDLANSTNDSGSVPAKLSSLTQTTEPQ